MGTSLVSAGAAFPEKFLCLPLEILVTLRASICVEGVLIASSVPVSRFAIEFAAVFVAVIILLVELLLLLLRSIPVRVFSCALVAPKAIEVPIGLILSLFLLLVRFGMMILVVGLLLLISACIRCILVVL